MQAIKTVFVQAHFLSLIERRKVQVPTGEKKRSWMGGEKEVTREEYRDFEAGASRSRIDGVRLAGEVAAACNQLCDEQYEIISVTPVTSGDFEPMGKLTINPIKKSFMETDKYATAEGGGGSGGGGAFGFSYTEGVLIMGRRIGRQEEMRESIE